MNIRFKSQHAMWHIEKAFRHLQRPDRGLWSRRALLWTWWPADPEKPVGRWRRRPQRGPWGPGQTGASLREQVEERWYDTDSQAKSVRQWLNIQSCRNKTSKSTNQDFQDARKHADKYFTTLSGSSAQPGLCFIVMDAVVPEVSDFWISPHPPGLKERKSERKKKHTTTVSVLLCSIFVPCFTSYRAEQWHLLCVSPSPGWQWGAWPRWSDVAQGWIWAGKPWLLGDGVLYPVYKQPSLVIVIKGWCGEPPNSLSASRTL